MAAAIPIIKVANYADATCIGSPNSKQRPINRIDTMRPRPQHALSIAMMAMMECVHFLSLQLRPETVGVNKINPLT